MRTPNDGETDYRSAVCAVIVSYNIGFEIHACVNSIRNQVSEVVIVDNGSDPETRLELEKLSNRSLATVFLNEQNKGIACALNQGFRYGLERGYRWFLTLDHDSEATPGMVAKLLDGWRAAEARGAKVGIVAANTFDKRSHTYYLGGYQSRETEVVVEVPTVISSGSLIGKTTFEIVGFQNEELFLYYVDDDFCLRLRRAGLEVFLCPSAILLHQEGNRVSRNFLGRKVLYNNYGKEACYYISRNACYMLRKLWEYKELRYFYRIATRLAKDAVKVVLYDEQPIQKLSFTIRGIRDGIRGRYGQLRM
ncbi:MAG: glycosyltransferase [Terriglobia bacterium]|jgi:rhamnosyltransferase